MKDVHIVYKKVAGSDRKIGHLSLCFVSKQSIYLYENTAKRKLNVICFHISLAISSLDLIGPESTQLGDLKITQPPKLDTYINMNVFYNFYIR